MTTRYLPASLNRRRRSVAIPTRYSRSTTTRSFLARARLSLRVRDVPSPLWSFRVNGEQRIWGLKFGPEFHVLWWDPHHRVYPSTLRNT